MFLTGVAVFIICMTIQFFAFHRKAWGRNLFISTSMYVFVGLLAIAPNAPRWLVWTFLILISVYVLVLTVFAVGRLVYGKKR